MGPKLDFVREHVPNVRSPTFFPLSVARHLPPQILSFIFLLHLPFSFHPIYIYAHTYTYLLSFPTFSSNSSSSSCRDSRFPRDTRRRRDAPPHSAVLCIFHRFLWNSFSRPLLHHPHFSRSLSHSAISPSSLPRLSLVSPSSLPRHSLLRLGVYTWVVVAVVVVAVPLAHPSGSWIFYGDFPINPVELSIDQAEQYSGRRL